VCWKLNSLYPPAQWAVDDDDTDSCFNRAIAAATTQEKAVIATASRK
jgi:hypothetical protein